MKAVRSSRVMARLNAWLAVALIALLAAPSSASAMHRARAAGQPGPEGSAHYIVFVQRSDGSIRPLAHRNVTLAAGLISATDAQLAAFLARPSRDLHALVATLRSPAGQTLFQTAVEVPQWLRGEFAEQDGTSIDGHLLALEELLFVVRVPALPQATLVLSPRGEKGPVRPVEFDLDRLASTTPPIDLEALHPVHSVASPEGDPANRFDLLIMGDGYTDAQQSDFEADAQQVAAQFFGVSPLAEYANYANVHTLFTPSAESGSDHPPYSPSCGYEDPTCCGDPQMLSDPLQGTMVDTAFDSRYCAYWVHRLLYPDEAKVLAAAAAVPDWDSILLLVNDATYGGSGGIVATIAMHSSAVQIAQHEFGHSFAGLADEYESPYPGYPPCSDLYGPDACEPNVTDVTVREQIKWNPWIEPTTPIPTPEEYAYNGLVGLFEGARYQYTGMYRSGLNCIMRALGQPFCQVPSQTYVLRLYDGGWGVPEEGIRLIEPGSAYPGSPVVLVHPAQQTFGADILQPVGGPDVEIAWLVNGEPVSGEHDPTFTYVTQEGELGVIEITLLVQDVTTLVHPDMAGDSLQSAYTWQVEVHSALYLPLVVRSYSAGR
jgi:hypothetical protein